MKLLCVDLSDILIVSKSTFAGLRLSRFFLSLRTSALYPSIVSSQLLGWCGDWEIWIMKALDTKFVKLIFAVLIILFVMWLMSVLQCKMEMATPAY